MLFTTEQINQVHTLLQEYPEANYVVIEDVENGSGIGPTTYAKFMKYGLRKATLLGTVDITDVSTW